MAELQEPELQENLPWYASKAFRRYRRSPLALIGTFLLVSFTVLAILAPVITAPQIAERSRGHTCARDLGLPRDEVEALSILRNPFSGAFWRVMTVPPGSCLKIPRVGFSPIPKPPSSEHIMGIASGGYDIFYGVIWGARLAFYVGLLVSSISFVLGMIIGGLAGFFGGWMDDFLMRFTDTVFAFPNLILAVVFVTIFGPSLTTALTALALVGWTTYARVFRGDIMRVRQLEYVDGAQALGANKRRVFFRHVLPNSLGSLVVIASLDIGTVVVTAATLSFLGLGAEVGTADWGQMVNFARQYIQGSAGNSLEFWYISFWPGLGHRPFCSRLEPIGRRLPGYFRSTWSVGT